MNSNQQNSPEKATPPPSGLGSLFDKGLQSNNNQQQKKVETKGLFDGGIFSSSKSSSGFSFGGKTEIKREEAPIFAPAQNPLSVNQKMPILTSDQQKNQLWKSNSTTLFTNLSPQAKNAFTFTKKNEQGSSNQLLFNKKNQGDGNIFPTPGSLFGKHQTKSGQPEKEKQLQPKTNILPQVKNTPASSGLFTSKVTQSNNRAGQSVTPSLAFDFNKTSSLFPSSSSLFGQKNSSFPNPNQPKKVEGQSNTSRFQTQKNQSTPSFKQEKGPEYFSGQKNILGASSLDKKQNSDEPSKKANLFEKTQQVSNRQQSLFSINSNVNKKQNEPEAVPKLSLFSNLNGVGNQPHKSDGLLPQKKPTEMKVSQENATLLKSNQAIGLNNNTSNFGFLFGSNNNKSQANQNENSAKEIKASNLQDEKLAHVGQNLAKPQPENLHTPANPKLTSQLETQNQKPRFEQPEKKVDAKKSPTPQPKFMNFKQSMDVSNSQAQVRDRSPTFDTKNDTSMFSINKPQKESASSKSSGEYFELKKLSQFLCSGSENQISQSSMKIEASFRKYLPILRAQNHGIIYRPMSFIGELKPEEGVNKLINDFTVALAGIFHIPDSNYHSYGQLFISMLKQLGYYDKLFDGLKLRETYFLRTKMYNTANPDNLDLIWEGDEAAALISQFVKYFSSLILKCLKKVEVLLKCFKKTGLYDLLLQTIIQLNFRYPITQNSIIVEAMRANDVRMMSQINKILLNLLMNQFTAQNNQDIISKKCVLGLIELANELPQCPTAKIFQRIVLKQLNLDRVSRDSNKQLISKLAKTTSLPFLPFRAILHRLDRSKKKIDPAVKDLFSQIDGPEWIDWLSVYLGEDNIRLREKQVECLIKSLKQMQINNIEKIVNKESQINRLILIMLQQNQVKNFYETISALVYDQDSMKKVEEQYFKQNPLFSDLRLLANEIRKFPNCELNEEDMPELVGKSLYFLTILSIQPDRALQLENALFDIDGFMQISSQRCDRICNLVIDILAYFSIKTPNEEIITKSFQAITSLFQCHTTKSNMSLAMTINRPQIQFLYKSISTKIAKKIQQFLIHLIWDTQFYSTTRLMNQNESVQKVYPFRYQISKYLILTEKINLSIPLYWFSHCLKISTKQTYSPELLEAMLSRLKIYPSGRTSEAPYILSTIVEASNLANFWKELSSKIEAQAVLRSDRYFLQNKFLSEESDPAAVITTFSSLNLLKTMVELLKIKQKAQKQYPRHFICHLLSSLNCLNQLERQYIQLGSEPELNTRKTVPPLISLLCLMSESSPFWNTRLGMKIEWQYQQNKKINLGVLEKINRDSQEIDYGILKDPLIHPYNESLDCLENISSLASYVLKELISEIKETSLDSLLYMSIPVTSNHPTPIQHYLQLRQEIIINFKQCLGSSSPSLRRNSWALLSNLRNTAQNKKLAKDIFYNYCEGRSLITLNPSLRFLLECVAAEARDHLYNSSEILMEVMQKLASIDLKNIVGDIETYKEQASLTQSLHQFFRSVQEKNIMAKLQYFRMCDLLGEIVLREIYDNHPQAAIHSAQLIKIYTQTQMIDAFSKSAPQIPDQPGANPHICNSTIPRLYGKDILQMYITSSDSKLQDLIPIQASNVRNWFFSKISNTMAKVNAFLSVVLSINQTYYANHPIKLSSFKKSEIFCQRHLETTKYKGYEFFAISERDAASQVRFILNFLLKKIQAMRRQHLSVDILKLYSIFDLLLGWLQNCKTFKKSQLVMQCQGVLSFCFNQLEEPFVDHISAKLVLSCVKILGSHMHQEVGRKIKQAIVKTLSSIHSISSDLRQELLSLFVIIPPNKDELQILELVAKMWFTEENNQYFYNECRVIYKFCQIYPFEMAQLKILSKCERILKFEGSTLQGVRYRQNLRTNEAKNWLWILKIATVLLENGMKSTLVVHQISKFLENNKKRLIFTFNEYRQELNLKKKKQMCIKINLAQLDELEGSLEFFVVLAQSKMWIQMNRQMFEEMLYYLMHRTIVLFAPSSVGQKLRKKYIPQSRNEKLMWDLQAGESPIRQQVGNVWEGYDPDRIEEEYATQLLDYNAQRPSVFILAMSLRYNQCLKLWLLGCSFGMRSSCFVREHFSKPIMLDARGNSLKYSLTHWEHLNKALSEIMQGLTNRVRQWGKWHTKNQLLNILNDCFQSAQFFTEAGYTYTLVKLPQNEEELISELGQTLAFALEMGACHLVSQVYFKNKSGAFWKENLQSFQEKLLKLSALGEQKLIQNKISREDPVLQLLKASKQLLSQVKYG